METFGLGMSARLDQYSGAWAIDAESFRSILAQVERMNMAAHTAVSNAPPPKIAYAVDQTGVATIAVSGVMTKMGSSLSPYSGSVQLRRAIRQATHDAAVNGIMIRVDSPGGTVAGTGDLADEIARANRVKPVHAYVEDRAFSAAYWLVASAGRASASPNAFTGSIGTFMAIADWSRAAENDGVKVHVVRAGQFKGAGTMGTMVTPEQLAEFQREVDLANAMFLSGVSAGRKLPAEHVAALADGRIHSASGAVDLRLLDAIETEEAAVERLREAFRAAAAGSRIGGRAMASTTVEAPVAAAPASTVEAPVAVPQPKIAAASLADLRAAVPNASSEFLIECLDKARTVEQAKDAWISAVEARAKAAEEKLAAEAQKVAKAAGAAAIQTVASGSPDRDAIIATARRSFSAERDERVVLCGERAWVNLALRDSGHSKLTDEEARAAGMKS